MDAQLAALIIVATAYAKDPDKAKVAKALHANVQRLIDGTPTEIFKDIEMAPSGLIFNVAAQV